MPIPIPCYKCSVCGKIYFEYQKAAECEEKDNKCKTCSNGYYVYGCEFNCSHAEECNYFNEYPYYNKKENV